MKTHPTLWMAICSSLILSLAGPAQALSTSTVTLASSPAWGGQHVCLNALFPVGCPADATKYGYPFAGWAAPRPFGDNWIWLNGVTGDTLGADLATASFSQTVVLTGAPISGAICLAADDFAELTVNGAVVGSVGSTTNPALAALAQSTSTCFDVTSFLLPGSNDITVNGQNGPKTFSPFQATGCNPSCSYKENPAGVTFGGTVTLANPTMKEECKNGGWEQFGFENQGQCARFVETGKDSRTGG
jgi:hypothetical protein